ncbi:putative tyrosyl-tRNA synthetase, cytoplasmic [Rhypophila decipiens]|uniref:tyrosine--tRNA ligase n=1 Tax=Rhypophila decipiens TaxID=261697 RepID=A0AAN7B304_9PEZI|nr:putative tyrosyl-tRNA synthetase, cytoplasmic [Rhypophila decipiens]
MSGSLPTTTSDLTPEAKYDLIVSNPKEVMRGDIIRKILAVRPLKIYWGTATTGRPHADYFVPAIKIAQFLRAGCNFKILLADLHGFLDADKAPESVLEHRAQYYERLYQLTPKFNKDLMRLGKRVSIHDAIKASSEVVKSSGDPCMADGTYPLMQVLDEEYLDVDAQFGGLDQRKIFALANDTIHKLGYKVRAHLMNPMVPGLSGGKMSSSDPRSKIDLIDDEATIRKKIAKAVCAPRMVEGNRILAFIQHVLLPFEALRSEDGIPCIEVVLRDQTEPTKFTTFEQVAAAYEADTLTPQLAKSIVQRGLVELTAHKSSLSAHKEAVVITTRARTCF